MKIIQLDEVDSTHIYLQKYIKKNGYFEPISVVTLHQTRGIGSRGNYWHGVKGNLFFSFVVSKEDLPLDLQIQSASIYFAYVLKTLLAQMGSGLWVKWPNDFYIEDKKVGGVITSVVEGLVYCGIGLNLKKTSQKFGYLDIEIDLKEILKLYFNQLVKWVSWKKVLTQYKIEFQKSKYFCTTVKDNKIPLNKAVLNEDGSIYIDGEKVYSLR